VPAFSAWPAALLGPASEVEGEAFVSIEPSAHLGMLVRGVIVEDLMHGVAGASRRSMHSNCSRRHKIPDLRLAGSEVCFNVARADRRLAQEITSWRRE
jgi:hypothetical protein